MQSEKKTIESGLLYITLATGNYLHYVATLAESLFKYNKDAHLICYLVDEGAPVDTQAVKNVEFVSITELPIAAERSFLFQYDVLELICALKPIVAKHALEKYSSRLVIYLDSDMYVCDKLSCLEEIQPNSPI